MRERSLCGDQEMKGEAGVREKRRRHIGCVKQVGGRSRVIAHFFGAKKREAFVFNQNVCLFVCLS